MGMYNTLNGEQVKCFFVPCGSIDRDSKELNDVRLSYYTSGGRLNYYAIGDEVPYKTPYYNYGKDFVIFDYRIYHDCGAPEVIVIRDGKLYATISSLDVTDKDIEGISLFVNNYGDILNINSADDLRQIVKDYKNTMERYDELNEQYEKEYGCENLFGRREEIKQMNEDEVARLFELSREARNRAWNETYRITNNKWYCEDEEKTKKVHGGFTFGYMFDNLSGDYMTEWEKYKAVAFLKEKLQEDGESFEDGLEKYIVWAKNAGIDENDIRKLFEKYDREPTENVIKEYLESDNYQFYLKIHADK